MWFCAQDSIIDRVAYDWVVVCKTHPHERAEREDWEITKQSQFPRDIPPVDPLVGELKLKLQQLSLQVHGFPSTRDSSRYFLQITATEDVLLSWAEEMKLPMRLTTKASVLLDKLYELKEELLRLKRLDRSSDMKDLTKSEFRVMLWVGNLQDALFKRGGKGEKAVEAALAERFGEFGQVLNVWVRFKHGDAGSARQENQSWALVTLVPESLSSWEYNGEDQEWEPNEEGVEMLKDIKLDPEGGHAQAAVHTHAGVELEPLIVKHQKRERVMHTKRGRKPRKRQAIIEEIKETKAELTIEHKKRQHPEFEAMMPFKVDVNKEFQRNRTRRVAQSAFCSGERQRIIRHILENEISGFDLDNSRAARPSVRHDVWKNMAFEQATDAYAVLTTAEFDGEKLSKAEHETRMHLIQSILLDESRDAGHPPKTEKHRMWLDNRMAVMNRSTMAQLRERSRTWDCVEDFTALHDFHEMEFLKYNWVERQVLVDVRRSLGWLGHPTAAGAPLRGELRPHRAINAFTTQPLNEIRDYFGEQTAIYFAFAELYTQALVFPAIAGLLCVLATSVWRSAAIEGYSFGFTYHVFVSVWTVVFLQEWRRKQTALNVLWGTENYQRYEKARPQFLALARDPLEMSHTFEWNSLTDTLEPTAKSAWHRPAKMAASMLLLMFFFVLVFSGVIAAQWVKLGDPTDPDSATIWKFAGITMQVCLIGLFGVIYGRLSTATTDWEHHRTQTEYNSSQIAKVFVFEAVNNFFVLFFIAFLKGGTSITVFDTLDARNATCTSMKISCGDDSLHESLLAKCQTTNGNGNVNGTDVDVDDFEIEVVSCMNELWMQLLVILSAGQVGIMVLKQAMPQVKYGVKRLGEMEEDFNGRKHLTAVGEQVAMPEYKNSTRQKEYSDKAIQFGYVVLFAVAFPFAPVFALINNWIEVRSSAKIITTQYRRPQFETAKGIGTWLYIFEAIAMAAVITNATLISFVGGQSADMWVSLFTTAGSAEEEQYEVLALPGSQSERVHDHKLWLVAGAAEHAIFALRFAIAIAIPTTPKWVEVVKFVAERNKVRRMSTPQQRQEEQDRREMLRRKFKKHITSHNVARRMTGLKILVNGENQSKDRLPLETE